MTDQYVLGQRMFDGAAPGPEAARIAALATGDLVGAAMEIARAIGREVDGDPYKGAAVALKRLVEQELITPRELDQLEELLDCLREAAGKRNVPIAVTRRARGIYLTLLSDPRSSLPALAIASGVCGLVAPRAKGDDGDDDSPQVVYLTFTEGVGVGAAIGASAGAAIGALGGGAAGALAGAVIGFVVGGVVGGACTEED